MWISRTKYNSLCRAAGTRLKVGSKDEFRNDYNETGMLLWRLSGKKQISGGELLPMPFEFIRAVDVDDKFIVLVVHLGKGLVFEDDYSLFPSDELVAKLRMLLK